jgi:hypothetical protein
VPDVRSASSVVGERRSQGGSAIDWRASRSIGAVEINPKAEAAVAYEDLCALARMRSASAIYNAWWTLEIDTSLLKGTMWPLHTEILADLVSRDEVRGELSTGSRRLVDVYGPPVPRCTRCDQRLVDVPERVIGRCDPCTPRCAACRAILAPDEESRGVCIECVLFNRRLTCMRCGTLLLRVDDRARRICQDCVDKAGPAVMHAQADNPHR